MLIQIISVWFLFPICRFISMTFQLFEMIFNCFSIMKNANESEKLVVCIYAWFWSCLRKAFWLQIFAACTLETKLNWKSHIVLTIQQIATTSHTELFILFSFKLCANLRIYVFHANTFLKQLWHCSKRKARGRQVIIYIIN